MVKGKSRGEKPEAIGWRSILQARYAPQIHVRKSDRLCFSHQCPLRNWGTPFFSLQRLYVFSHLMNLPHKVLGTGAIGVNSSTSSFINFIDLVGAATFTLPR